METDFRADLIAGLRDAADYATMAGLLKDAAALNVLEAAEAAKQRSEQPDLKAVSEALNELVALIAPLTLVDLRFDRNPLSRDNQARTRKFQFWLPLLALVLLLTIGLFMQSLRYAQSFIARVEQVQGKNPEQMLAVLQQMILFDNPLESSKPRDAMRERYLDKLAELQRVSVELTSLSAQADDLAPTYNNDLVSRAMRLSQTLGIIKTPAPPTQNEGIPSEFCRATASGELQLPDGWEHRPQWMQRMAADDLRNFCFKALLRANSGLASPSSNSIVPKLIDAAPIIKERVALYTEWILPFLYGLLGSMLYMMRTVGNIRLPAMHSMSILMRIALGGMAGIVMGWFAIGDPGGRPQVSSAVAWPFVLAFISGYGIEALFVVLDRMNRFIADTSYAKRDGQAGA